MRNEQTIKIPNDETLNVQSATTLVVVQATESVDSVKRKRGMERTVRSATK
jgi:hypothetical protein